MATPDRIERIAKEGKKTASAATTPTGPYYGAPTETVVIDGKSYTGVNVGKGKPPAATEVGMVSPSSGLTITGTERNMTKEREAMNLGYTKEYIASRGGINSQGYFNDTPLSGQLTAEEQRKVRLPDGTTNTAEMARILQEKQIAELVGQGMSVADATKRISAQYGQFGVPLVTTKTGGYDLAGNPVAGGQYDASGNYVGSSGGTVTGASTGMPATSKLTEAQKAANEEFRASLTALGLADLADVIDGFIRQDYTSAQIKLELPKTEAYKLRFPGMEALRASGRSITEATYIANERGYLQTLRANGLDTETLGSRTSLGTYIANDVSPREFEERVTTAVTRINQNPEIVTAFKAYYPEVDKSGIVTYLLNPKVGMDVIRKQVRVSEIGAAAATAGFNRDLIGTTQAEALISPTGDTSYNQLRASFFRARQLANTQRRLSQIEGQQYSDLEAVGAVVGGQGQLLLESEKRAQREAARFGQRGGLTAGSLRTAETAI
jgi:hypothetical protein